MRWQLLFSKGNSPRFGAHNSAARFSQLHRFHKQHPREQAWRSLPRSLLRKRGTPTANFTTNTGSHDSIRGSSLSRSRSPRSWKSLDSSIANVALPHIAGSSAPATNEATWILTSYLVSNAIILPISGWIANRVGRKRFYMSCVGVVHHLFVSLRVSHLSPYVDLLPHHSGRGGGGLQPSERAILADTFAPEKRSVAFALYGMAVVVAPAIGPTIGGWITDNYGWRWIFFLNIPVGILSIVSPAASWRTRPT